MDDPISLKKFFSGMFSAKTQLKTLAYVCIIAFWVLVGWAIYRQFVKPLPTTKQEATTMYNVYIYPNRKGFSLVSLGSWHLLSKDSDYNLKSILTEQVVKK